MRLSVLENLCVIKDPLLTNAFENDHEYWLNIGPEFRANLLESYKSRTQKRLEFTNTRIKEAISQPVPSWDSINKVAKNIKKEIEANGHNVNKDYPFIDGLRKLSPKEKAERASLQKEYTDKIIGLASEHATISSLTSMIASCNHRTNRSTDAFLTETGENGYENSVKNAEILLSGTDEEKVAFIESKLKKALEVYDLFTNNLYSDREACKLLVENYDTLLYMAELEKIQDLEDDFGVKIQDTELKAEIAKKTPAMVGLSMYRNTLSDIISPAYLEFDQRDIRDLKAAIDMTAPANDALKENYREIRRKLEGALAPNQDVLSDDMKAAFADTQNPFPYKLNELSTYQVNGSTLQLAREDMIKNNIEAQKFPEGAKFVGLDNVEIDKAQAIRDIGNGKIVNVFDKKNNLLKNYSEYSAFVPFLEKQENTDLRIDDMSPKQIKDTFKNIQKEVNGATRLFMRSSQEFRDFRSAIDEIVNIDLEELSDELIVRDRMEKVAQAAEKYLNLKQQQGTSITSNTEARINAANKVANLMRGSLAMQAERKHNLDTVKVGSYEEFEKGLEENSHEEFEDQTEEYTKSGKKIYKISGVDKAVYKAEQNRLHVDYETNYIDEEKATDFLDDEIPDMVESDFYKDLGKDSNLFPAADEAPAEEAELSDKVAKHEIDPPSV